MCRWAATVAPTAARAHFPLSSGTLTCSSGTVWAVPASRPRLCLAQAQPTAPTQPGTHQGSQLKRRHPRTGFPAWSSGNSPPTASPSCPSQAAVGLSCKAQRSCHPGALEPSLSDWHSSVTRPAHPLVFPSSFLSCLPALPFFLEPVSLLRQPPSLSPKLRPWGLSQPGLRPGGPGQRSELGAKFSVLQRISRDPGACFWVCSDSQRMVMGLAGVAFTSRPGNTQGPRFRPRPKSWGNSREKESEEPEQGPSTFLRAEAHCLLLQGEVD